MQKTVLQIAMFAGLALATQAHGQANKSLIAGYHENYQGVSNLTLTIFGSEGTTGTISNDDGFSEPFLIGPDGYYSTGLDLGDAVIPTDGTVSSTAIRVDASNPVSAMALNRRIATTDLTSLLTEDALGTEYYALGFESILGQASQLSITAVQDATEIRFTPATELSGYAAGTEHTVTLNAGESLGLSGEDVTGTHIESDSPVAVFGGALCANVPKNIGACDHLISQNFAVEDWSTDFRLVQTPQAGADADLVRIISATDGNEVFLDGVSQGTIDSGEFLTIDNVGNSHITASDPIQLGQFMRGTSGSRTLGDPAFSVVPGSDQWLSSYTFAVPTSGGDGEADFAQNYLQVVISESAAPSLVLNDVAVSDSEFSEREVREGFVHGIIPIEGGVGQVSAEEKFLAMISGLDSADSYLSTIALSFSTGASDPVMTTLPSEATSSGMPLAMMSVLGAESLRDRRGGRIVADSRPETVLSTRGTSDDSGVMPGGGFWLTLGAERQKPNTEGATLVDSFEQRNSLIRFGYDLPSVNVEGGQVVGGLFLEYADADSSILSTFGDTGIETGASGIGASLTWFGTDGAYADLAGRLLSFDNDIEGIDENQDGHGTILSVETGKKIALSDIWTITPQTQITYSTYNLDTITGPMGETLEFGKGRRVQGRIGADFERSWANNYGGMDTMFVSANYIHDMSFDGDFEVTAGGSTRSYEEDYAQRVAEIGLGGRFALNETSQLSGGIYASRGLEGNSGTNVRAKLSLDFRW